MPAFDEKLFHATTIALGEVAAMIVGPPGIGKSDLALRCLMMPAGPMSGDVAKLVSDDQTLLRLDGGQLIASAPLTISGKLEVRGLGILEVVPQAFAKVALVVALDGGVPERLPKRPLATTQVMGVEVSRLALSPFEMSAPAKLLLALANVMQFTVFNFDK